jgi:protein-S-isoprenylcysteine O-methyltransferase Ste14
MKLRVLVGSGDRIGLVTLPFLVIGVILNVAFPAVFAVGGPPTALAVVSVLALLAGVTVWAWSVELILTRVPRRRLITTGPYRLVRHPLYTGVALLVVPAVGFLCDSWLGVAVGLVMYLAARRYAPAEEAALAKHFGSSWAAYRDSVKVSWL